MNSKTKTKTPPDDGRKHKRNLFQHKKGIRRANFWLIFNQIVLVFAIGCIFGTYYEETLTMFQHLFSDGTVEWLSRSGLVYGPFSPIYGLGAVGVYLLFYRTRASWQTCLFGGALAGGAFEYLLSVLQEWIFNTRSWDYSDQFLNINGRTTIPFMFFWGLLVLVAAYWLYPLLNKAYERLEGKWMDIFCVSFAAFLIFDISMSIAANWRQMERRKGDPANTEVEEFLDETFPDEKLEEIYENTFYIDDK